MVLGRWPLVRHHRKSLKNRSMKRHTHRWGRQRFGIFNGPIRLCLSVRCSAFRYASGRVTYIGSAMLASARRQRMVERLREEVKRGSQARRQRRAVCARRFLPSLLPTIASVTPAPAWTWLRMP